MDNKETGRCEISSGSYSLFFQKQLSENVLLKRKQNYKNISFKTEFFEF